MTTKYRYFVYLLCLHLVIGWLAYQVLTDQLYWLLLVEVLLIISLAISFSFYKVFMTPTEVIDHGEAALSDGDFTVKFTSSDSPEVERLIQLYNGMIDNLRVERTGNEEQHYFLQKLMKAAELGVIILDYDGKIASINPWALRKTGLQAEDLIDKHIEQIEHPFIQHLQKVSDNGQPVVIQQAGGQRFRIEKGQFLDRGFDRTFLLIQDITRDLLTAEKEAYGKVIRMMAHEVNNSTGATRSMLNSLLDTKDMTAIDFQDIASEYLPLVIERGDMMNRFMRQFASVIRLPEPLLDELDLAVLINKIGRLFINLLAEENIQLIVPEATEKLIIKGDPAQLELVIINALTNARESLAGQSGTVRISIDKQGKSFTIADNGPGILPQDAAKVFTPFYSSKPTGQGIGLTLSRDILQGHGAMYDLKTDTDGWTRFVVKFSS